MIICLCRSPLVVLLYVPSLTAFAGDPFPFGTVLMLDAAPLRGSKRIPMLEVEESGVASIDLWCGSAPAQATVDDNSITIVPGDLQDAQCDPERQSRDADLLAELGQVTNWRRRSGDEIELSGPATLRFRPMTN
jgi:hypothetical protein